MRHFLLIQLIIILAVSCSDDQGVSQLTITPSTDAATATDSSTDSSTDSATDSSTDSATDSASPSNIAPTSSSDLIITSYSTLKTGALISSDSDGDTLTFAIVSNSANGNVVITNTATGAYTYTPSHYFSGADSFTFKANDGTDDSNTSTISITVNARGAVSVLDTLAGADGGSDTANGVATDASGNVFVSGSVYSTSTGNDLIIMKYNKSGSLDSGFGTEGIVTYHNTVSATTSDIGNLVLLPGNGDIIVVGESNSQVTIWKYDSSGALVTSFGTNGILISGTAGYGISAVVDSTGSIFISYDTSCGSNCYTMKVFKYDSNGNIETDFAGGNKVLIATGWNSTPYLFLDASGALYFASTAIIQDPSIYKLNATTGDFMTSFGPSGTGKLTLDVPSSNWGGTIHSIAEDGSGNLIVAGLFSDGAVKGFVSKINSDGSIVTSFGASGFTTLLPVGYSSSRIFAVKVDSKDDIYLAGKVMSGNDDIGIWKMDSTGSFISDFATNGFYDYSGDANKTDSILSMSIGIDGIVHFVGTEIKSGTQPDLLILKY